MLYETEIEIGNSFAEAPPNFADLKSRVEAAMNAINFLQEEVPVTPVDQSTARALFTNPDQSAKEMHVPGAIIHLKQLLSAYDAQIVHNTADLRNYITNRLLEETDNADARIRMKALELLGKISDVGLFTDKTEITYRHRPTEELERALREKLAKVIDVDPVSPYMQDLQPQITTEGEDAANG